jgi:hypothetical protein
MIITNRKIFKANGISRPRYFLNIIPTGGNNTEATSRITIPGTG